MQRERRLGSRFLYCKNRIYTVQEISKIRECCRALKKIMCIRIHQIVINERSKLESMFATSPEDIIAQRENILRGTRGAAGCSQRGNTTARTDIPNRVVRHEHDVWRVERRWLDRYVDIAISTAIGK